MHESLEIEIKLNEQQQELLKVMLLTYLEKKDSSEFTRTVSRQLLAKIEEQYEQS